MRQLSTTGRCQQRCDRIGSNAGGPGEYQCLVFGRESMLTMIEGLSPEQQQVLTLKFVFNFSNGEVAGILGKSEGAIKSLQHRALVSLQKQLESGTPPAAS